MFENAIMPLRHCVCEVKGKEAANTFTRVEDQYPGGGEPCVYIYVTAQETELVFGA